MPSSEWVNWWVGRCGSLDAKKGRYYFRGRTSEYSYFSFSSCPIDCQFYVKFTQLDARMFKYSIYLNICNVVVTY